MYSYHVKDSYHGSRANPFFSGGGGVQKAFKNASKNSLLEFLLRFSSLGGLPLPLDMAMVEAIIIK